MTARGLIVAAPRSGCGKTTVTLALLVALKQRGIAVRAAKAGPDYIDSAFHAAATGKPGLNLDSWAMPPALLDGLASEAARDAELLVIEGVMGLFDGTPGPPGRCGTTADLAARFRLPVLLVLDVSGQSQTAAAVVRGLASHDPAVRIAGVVLNRVGSERHRTLVTEAIVALNIPVFGAIQRDARLALPERHLGLVQAGEHADLTARLDQLGVVAERHLDLDAIIAAASPLADAAEANAPALPPPGQRIALASDAAFTFIYPHILDGWRRAGAEIVLFSPLADEPPPASGDCCWLPGGYPELHAGTLAAAQQFRSGLAQFAVTRPVHGECGGYMVLGEGLEDADGVRHTMIGLLGHATSFAQRKLHLGYRQARLMHDGPLGAAGTIVRGHEFHYAALITPGNDAAFADLNDGQGHPLGRTGGRRGRVSGAFFHAIAQA
jgi:cobyrinic acid a,c-diamide synthase